MTRTPSKHRWRGRFGLALLLSALSTSAADPSTSRPSAASRGPRGQPIRPPASQQTNAPAANVVTLPGGLLITNLPASVLPASPTNTVRLPTWAARKFKPLGFVPTSFTVLARFFPDLPAASEGSAPTQEARWDALRQQIPADVLALDGQKVALAGFVLPLTLQDGRTTRFLLLRTQSACCFGLMPRVNELVVVHVPAPGIRPQPDTPFVVAGKFHVQWTGEGDQLIAIYRMEGERVEVVKGS